VGCIYTVCRSTVCELHILIYSPCTVKRKNVLLRGLLISDASEMDTCPGGVGVAIHSAGSPGGGGSSVQGVVVAVLLFVLWVGL